MLKDDINNKLKSLVLNRVEITEKDRSFVSDIYNSIIVSLGKDNCLQVGSYSRSLSVKPLHDLDVLFILGKWEESKVGSPIKELENLRYVLTKNYTNPTNLSIEIKLQTHSITIIYKNSKEEVFSVDIVPSYLFDKNEFGDDRYKVPEILYIKHKNRNNFYVDANNNKRNITWINSDPRGYAKISQNLNIKSTDFRKTVKFLKAWKNSCEIENKEFKFKSFHIEQLVTQYYLNNPNLTIFDVIFKFLYDLKSSIDVPSIIDRANNGKYIDDYIEKPEFRKDIIIQAKDMLMIKFENLEYDSDLYELLDGEMFFKRSTSSESYLFDEGIMTLTEKEKYINVVGYIEKYPGFRDYTCPISLFNNKLKREIKIKFMLDNNKYLLSTLKWKVKNDENSGQIRGEITNNKTKNDPEVTQYIGNHYVECYRLQENVCIAKDKCFIHVIV